MIVMQSNDNVATALHDIPKGTILDFKLGKTKKKIRIVEKIPFGHKFAIKNIQKGNDIIKYGETIGEAIQKIETGRLVHIHNVVSKRVRGDIKN
jgi:altronate dehydratase small subunit